MSTSRETSQKADMVPFLVSWWSRRSAVEKRLVASVAVLAVLFFVLLGLVSYGFLRGGSGGRSIALDLSTEVCNTTACKEMAALILASMDESVDPCEDFYRFACQNWERRNPVPDDQSRYSNFDVVILKLRQDVKDILDKALYKMKGQNISDKVVMAYHSCTNDLSSAGQSDEAEARMLRDLLVSSGVPVWPLRRAPVGIDVLSYSFFSKLYMKTGVSPIFKITVAPDAKNVTDYVFNIDRPKLGLGMYQLLAASTSENEAIVQAYKAFIAESMNALDPHIELEDLKSAVENVFDFEVELSKRIRRPEKQRDDTRRYNVKSIAQLQREAPGVDWLRFINALLKNVNITVGEDEMIVVKEPSYVSRTAQLLNTVDRATVYNYMGWRVVQEVAPATSRKFSDLKFALDRAVLGLRKNLPVWQRCVHTLNQLAGHALGRLYIEQKFSAEAKKEADHLVSDLRGAFARLLAESRWMDPLSKQEAFDKLKLMISHIAHPHWLSNATYLSDLYAWVGEITPGASFLDIYLNFVQGDVVRRLRRLHTFYDRSNEWPAPPTVTKGFYDPTANAISFPAGILQSPFYTYGLPVNINMGTIGTIIGHEITHAFDDSGSLYDGQGNLRNWWTKETRAEFKRKAQCFVEQYGRTIDLLANMTQNEISTHDENIGDNGGLRQAFRAQRIAIAKTGAFAAPALPGLEKYTSDQMFFISMARARCSNTRTKDMKYSIQYDRHSLDRYRVNTAVGNFVQFSKAFHCAEDSPMNFKEKCVLW